MNFDGTQMWAARRAAAKARTVTPHVTRDHGFFRVAGAAGGAARAKIMSPEQRRECARKAGLASARARQKSV